MTRANWRSSLALALPLLLVNSAAVWGQAGWGYDHLGHNLAVAVLFALAVESIGVYLAAEAHSALMAGDASLRLRLGSYAVGLVAGAANYAHFASAGYRVNPLAVTFGLLSSISPWLWAIRSRSLNRDRLRELGQIDPRAVKFSPLRWVLYPVRTFRAFRAAVWYGIVAPAEAVALSDTIRSARGASRILAGPVADDHEDTEAGTVVSDVVSDKTSDTHMPGEQPKRARKPLPTAERVARLRERQPDLSVSDMAWRLKVGERTVQRYLPKPPEVPPAAGDVSADVSDTEPAPVPA